MAFSVNVPNAPGVPSVNFAETAGAALSYLVSDVAGIYGGAGQSQRWGIYRNGAPVVIADNVIEVGYRNSWTIADYPIEEGAFESYDKVSSSFQTRVTFSTGGTLADRTALITSIEAIMSDLNLYQVVMPEKVLINCNVSRVDYDRRGGGGAGMLVVNVGLEEIRVKAAAVGSNTASPSSAAQTNNGTTQAQTPPANVTAATTGGTQEHLGTPIFEPGGN